MYDSEDRKSAGRLAAYELRPKAKAKGRRHVNDCCQMQMCGCGPYVRAGSQGHTALVDHVDPVIISRGGKGTAAAEETDGVGVADETVGGEVTFAAAGGAPEMIATRTLISRSRYSHISEVKRPSRKQEVK